MRQWIVLATTAVGAVVVSKVLFEDVLGFDLHAVAVDTIGQPGVTSAVAIIGLLALDIVVPVPSSLVMVLSGAVFGVLWGTWLSLVGSMAGAWLGFELARRYGRGASLRIVGERTLRELEGVFSRHGAMAVVVTRALPIAMEATSIVAGLSRMGRRRFLTAALIGYVPIAVAYAYVGAWSRQTGSVVPGTIIMVAVAAGWLVYRWRVAASPTRHDRPRDVQKSRDVA